MDQFQRAHVAVLMARLRQPPHRLIAVSGPRQTGKSTIVHQALEQLRAEVDAFFVAVDRPGVGEWSVDLLADTEAVVAPRIPDVEWLVRVWVQARQRARKSTRRVVLVLDEIQKVPDWSNAVKGLWDEDRRLDLPLHVVLLGSAPLVVQKGLSESLAGRFERIPVAHWSFDEMHRAFGLDVDQYVYFGGYPGAASWHGDQPRWREYVRAALIEPHIDKDILALSDVRKPALLKHVFELGAHYSGQVLSYNKMLGQLQDAGNNTTLAHYLSLLSSVGLVAGVEKLSRERVRRRASSPKLNVFNTALMSALSGYTFEQAKADRTMWGRLVESAVGAHLLNSAMADHLLRPGCRQFEVHYWRYKGHGFDVEVDFVLESGGRLVSIEVKSGRDRQRGGREKFRTEFAERFHREVLVADRGVPLNEFLLQPPARWFDEEP